MEINNKTKRDHRNRDVITKLAITTLMMFTLPIAAYFVVYMGMPRLYPDVPINIVQTIGGFTSIVFVILIAILYLISAFLE